MYIRPVSKMPTPQQLTDYWPIPIMLVLALQIELSCGTTFTQHYHHHRQPCNSMTSSPSAQLAQQLRQSSTCYILSPTNWKQNLTLSPFPWTSPGPLTLCGIRHYCINWLNSIFLIKFTTGWLISLITISTALHSVKSCPHCLQLTPVIIQGSAIEAAAYVVTAGDLNVQVR